MSENKHTPEPWRTDLGSGTDVINAADEIIAYCCSKDVARRIVACVNACSGIGNELLENICMISGGIAGRFAEQRRYLNETEKQRDELLATVIAAASLAHHESAVKALLDDALASMKGGA